MRMKQPVYPFRIPLQIYMALKFSSKQNDGDFQIIPMQIIYRWQLQNTSTQKTTENKVTMSTKLEEIPSASRLGKVISEFAIYVDKLKIANDLKIKDFAALSNMIQEVIYNCFQE